MAWEEMLIQGVSAHVDSGKLLFHIDSITPEFEIIIRKRLTEICYGHKKASSSQPNYSYTRTLKEFIKRYEPKSDEIKLGMIGELIIHILLLEYKGDLVHASPFFNLEERSIKKGYDLILFDISTDDLWIAEVKSGRLHKNKTIDQTCSDLIHAAKIDLHKRLNQQQTAFWQNAINAAMVCLDSGSPLLEAVNNVLCSIDVKDSQGTASSIDKNVMLAAGLFVPLSEGKISASSIDESLKKINDEKKFKQIIAIVFQKGTIETVINFLKREAG